MLICYSALRNVSQSAKSRRGAGPQPMEEDWQSTVSSTNFCYRYFYCTDTHAYTAISAVIADNLIIWTLLYFTTISSTITTITDTIPYCYYCSPLPYISLCLLIFPNISLYLLKGVPKKVLHKEMFTFSITVSSILILLS